ncbi:hypothetical protein BYT27DRAFT_7138256 [Phlegmacium glaucopus]|nr:hypothetical protein BYT27DRAFT_7138256 [Phlegmacium glaucopus]
MPKSTHSPPSPHSKPSSSPTSRMSDVAIRKKKNADAQAAFRARRANYIATLEETVTSLESVVLQLQESCRESRNEVLELRQENDRLRLENRERDKFWRAHYQPRKTGHPPDSDDHPPPLSSPFLGQAQVNALASHQTNPLIQHPYANGLGYRSEDYNTAGPNSFANQSPSVPFSSNESSTDAASALNHRSAKYPAHPYGIQGPPRDPRWSVQSGLNGESANSSHSQSPTYIDSPSLATTDMSFTGRFPGEEQKTALSSMLDNAPYVFPNGDRFVTDSVPNSRSLSPTSSTPGSATSIPLTSSFQFTFSEQSSSGQDRAEFDYRRHSLPHCPEVTLHGGTADVSLTGQSADAVRYRIGGRHSNDTGVDHRTIVPGSENGDHGSSDGDPPFNHLRRNPIHSHSRSPSPNAAPISCTVAVIKAQAFGALRRTRARTKKTSEGAAKVAMNVLEARGIGIGVPSKRPRLQDDEDLDVETP